MGSAPGQIQGDAEGTVLAILPLLRSLAAYSNLSGNLSIEVISRPELAGEGAAAARETETSPKRCLWQKECLRPQSPPGRQQVVVLR